MTEFEVSTREIDWRSVVIEADPDHFKDDIAYEFSNGRVFLSTDKSNSGIYKPD